MSPVDVLLVDDDADIRASVRLALEIEGYAIAVAADGSVAWKWLHAEPTPRLVLLDLMMPVMDGAEFLRLLRGDPELRALPVVLVTAFGATSRAVGLAAETQGCLAKPIDLDELIEIVSRHCPRPGR